MAPLFSIVIPVYNAAPYLAQCLDSVLGQSCGEFELFLVDDGSTDGSGAICDAYAEKDPRIQVIHQENAGPTPARRAGLARAAGEYVGFVDADDWVLPHWLETVRGYIDANGRPDVVVFDLDRDVGPVAQPVLAQPGFYDKARLEAEIYPYMLLDSRRRPYGSQLFPGYLPTKITRRELMQAHYLRDDRITLFEDTATSYECMFFASTAYISRERLYVYRRMASSNLNRYRPAYVREADMVLDYMREHLGGRSAVIDKQINGFGASRIVHGMCMEYGTNHSVSVTAQNVRRAMEETGFARKLSARGLPPDMALFLLMVKCRLYRAAALLIKARMQPSEGQS